MANRADTAETNLRPERLSSVDAYRGLVMLLMLAEALQLGLVAKAIPASPIWRALAACQTHVEWVGCSLHDLIQPGFSFLVGVALPFSIASRKQRGQSAAAMTRHAFFRSAILVLLGILLRSIPHTQTNFVFTDTLGQIGLGYGLLFMLGLTRVPTQWVALAAILLAYWALFALYPLPSANFDYAKVGVAKEWLSRNGLTGFAAHWNKNSNPAAAFDVWFLNLFPRERSFEFNPGGYATLSFIPTLATMILGLLAGEVLINPRSPRAKARWLINTGLFLLAAGWLAEWLGLCPIVKRIWTPSWVLWSGGLSLLILAAFYMVIDMRQRRSWAFPLIVIGMNSIAAYCIEGMWGDSIRAGLKRHFGSLFAVFGSAYEPLVLGVCQVLVIWLMLFWMYRRRIFLRV